MPKSALQEFEAQRVLHERGEALLKKSIQEARRAGYLPNRKIRVALDRTPILGQGAVKDTSNLLAEGIVKLGGRWAAAQGEEVTAWVQKHELSRYGGSSLKGEAAIDWDRKTQRQQLLTPIVQDGRGVLSLAEKVKEEHPEQGEALEADAALLKRLIAQDVEEKPDGPCQIKPGTEKDRVVSVQDAEMRHGRKSASRRFDGHKAAVAAEIESQLISAVEVLPGHAGDQQKALEMVEQSERVMEAKVEETVGDCAYGGGPRRRALAEAERPLTAKVPASHNGDCFPKSELAIDLERMEARCPAGQTTHDYHSAGEGRGGHFTFAAADGQACPLRPRCVKGQGPRTITVQAEERLQQQARAPNPTEAGRKSLRERVVVEHRIARLVGLGLRQSRYFGRKKTGLQVVMAAGVANLTLGVGFCRRQAAPAGAGAEKASAELGNSLLVAFSSLWHRYFAWLGLAWCNG